MLLMILFNDMIKTAACSLLPPVRLFLYYILQWALKALLQMQQARSGCNASIAAAMRSWRSCDDLIAGATRV
jgi:hypothetical protein